MLAANHELPSHVAVIGAAGGLGQGILSVCRAEGIGFTAIIRSRPERIGEIPHGSRVALATSLADRSALTDAFSGANAVLAALGVTATSQDRSALLSANMATIEQSMSAVGVDRIILINTLLASSPGNPASLAMRFFSLMPGRVGRGALEQQAVIDALGKGAFSSLRWTLVRAGVNSRGKDERPVASMVVLALRVICVLTFELAGTEKSPTCPIKRTTSSHLRSCSRSLCLAKSRRQTNGSRFRTMLPSWRSFDRLTT